MKIEQVDVPEQGHLQSLYVVELEEDDIGEPTDGVKSLLRTIIPDANALTIREFTRQVRRRYARRQARDSRG